MLEIALCQEAPPLIHHPEVQAKRASKDAGEAPGPSPFEGRSAATPG
jgi:hypothetical protein